MAVIGEEIRDYVKNQINARQTLHGSGAGHAGISRTGKQINLLNSNTSWIKLASGVSVSEAKLIDIGLDPSLSDTTLAENFVLFSGISRIKTNIVEETNKVTQEITEKFFTQLEQREGFLPRDGNSSYTYGSYGFSPMPGIHSADIKTLTRGSLKKATVKLTANNKQQFDIIDILYMRLGYTVLLEWGNSIYTTTGFDKEILRNTLIEEKFFQSYGSNSYITFLDDIEAKRDKHAGNYDALLGKVSNFSWSFNSDGSYDIELTIISLGDVIESLKSNLSVDKATNKFLNAIKSAQKISDTPPPENPKPDINDAKYSSIENLIDRNIAFANDIAAYNEAEKAKEEEKKNNPQDEEVIDDENSSADTITALLTIWKYISQDLSALTTADPSNSQAIQLVTTDSTGQGDFKTIGSLLNPNVEETDFTAGTVNVIYTITYKTVAEVEYEANQKRIAADIADDNINTTTYIPSDIRLKTNIKLIDTIEGLNIYLYNYLWDLETIYKGVMAQELLNTEYSNSVAIHDTGYYVVDYSKLPISSKIKIINFN